MGIPLSSETILILYYFHFTGFMTSPYPHIISRGNFTPSRPSCFLLFFFPCLSPPFLSFYPSLYLLPRSVFLTTVKLLVSFYPAAGLPSAETGTHQKSAACLPHTHTHTHTHTPSIHIMVCLCVYC